MQETRLEGPYLRIGVTGSARFPTINIGYAVLAENGPGKPPFRLETPGYTLHYGLGRTSRRTSGSAVVRVQRKLQSPDVSRRKWSRYQSKLLPFLCRRGYDAGYCIPGRYKATLRRRILLRDWQCAATTVAASRPTKEVPLPLDNSLSCSARTGNSWSGAYNELNNDRITSE